MSHRHGEDDHRIGSLALDQLLEMLLPAGRDPAPDHLPRHPVADALLVQALPELPPGGRAPVAEIEVDGGRDGEDLRSAHGWSVAEGGYDAVRAGDSPPRGTGWSYRVSQSRTRRADVCS